MRNTDAYLSNVTMAKSYIEVKKNDLDAAMKIARELKLAPSLRTYCDLNQVLLVVHNVGCLCGSLFYLLWNMMFKTSFFFGLVRAAPAA